MKKNTYKAYTKVVNEHVHYIVKKYEIYPDMPNVSPVLIAMGMDQDFIKACRLAKVESEEAVHGLMEKLDLARISGEVVPAGEAQRKLVASKPLSLLSPLYWIAKLKWARI